MLNSPHAADSAWTDGVTLTVDPIRFIASVKTSNGKVFTEVSWLLPTGGLSETGFHITPSIGDKVLVSTSLGYPLIIGTIPRIGTYNGQVQEMCNNGSTIDLGYDSNLGQMTTNPSKPDDYAPGDFIYTARGGGMIGILSGGISMLTAGPMAQFILTKFEGLARLVTRNYQRFSDASSRVSVNMKGRLYEYFAVDTIITNNQIGQERYQEAWGDIVAAETLKAAPDPSVTLPGAEAGVGARVRRKWLLDSSSPVPKVLYDEVLHQDGSITQVIENAAATSTSTTTVNNAEWRQQVNTASVTITPTSVIVDFNGVSTGTFNASGITLHSSNAITVTAGAELHLTGGSVLIDGPTTITGPLTTP